MNYSVSSKTQLKDPKFTENMLMPHDLTSRYMIALKIIATSEVKCQLTKEHFQQPDLSTKIGTNHTSNSPSKPNQECASCTKTAVSELPESQEQLYLSTLNSYGIDTDRRFLDGWVGEHWDAETYTEGKKRSHYHVKTDGHSPNKEIVQGDKMRSNLFSQMIDFPAE